MKTAAAVAHSLRTPFVVEDVELPALQDADVLVRIVAVGVCHTDLTSRDGQLPAPFPAIFGHEGAGVVEHIGDRVRKVIPGDHVVLAPDSDGIGTALTSLAKRGTLGLVAVPPFAEKKLDVPWASVLLQGQTVRGFMEGNSIPDIFIPQMIELYAQGRFPFDKFVRFYPFAEINRAVEDQRNGIAIKPILEVAAARLGEMK